VCSDSYCQVGKTGDYDVGSNAGQGVNFARSVRMANAVSPGIASGEDVGYLITDEAAFERDCVVSDDGLVDEVRAGLEHGWVRAGAGDYRADGAVKGMAFQVGMHGLG